MSLNKLASHQLYALNVMEFNDYLGIFYQAGCGKTAIALAWIYDALERGKIQRALVVCPAPLVSNWEDSITKMLSFEGYTEEGIARMKLAVKVTSFQKIYEKFEGSSKLYLRPEVDRQWGAIFVDESHNLGSHSSNQTKACLTLAKNATYRYIMSGTPVSGGGGKEDFQKLYGQIKFLRPDIWKNWTEFDKRYVIEHDRYHKPAKYNVESCRQLMYNYGIVARLEDCFDMPEKTETTIKCPLSERKVYKELTDFKNKNFRLNLYTKYHLDIESAGGQYLKCLQLCSGHFKNNEGKVLKFTSSKDKVLENILESTDDKIVIFCHYTASIDHVKALCDKIYDPNLVLTYDGRSTEETWKDFQNKSEPRVLISQYQKGGTGLDLYSSHTMVLWEPCLSSLILEQTLARIYRKGQRNNCNYIYLETPNSIESKVWLNVRNGVTVTTEMLEEWANGEGDRH